MKRRLSFAIVLLSLTGSLQAEELGRLFYTPMQRAELDRKRLSNSTTDSEPERAAPQLTVNGRMTRSDGKTTTWVNGVPDYDQQGSGVSTSRAQVGQTIDTATGQTRDSLGGGSLVIQPTR